MPADLTGIHIRVLPSKIQERTFELLGARPQIMDLTDAIRMIKAGEIDVFAHCHAQDARMLCRALEDRISKPMRSVMIPGFGEMEQVARKAGAEAFVLCGSGPAMMAVMPADVPHAPVLLAMRDRMASLGMTGEVFDTTPLAEVRDPAIPLPGL